MFETSKISWVNAVGAVAYELTVSSFGFIFLIPFASVVVHDPAREASSIARVRASTITESAGCRMD